MNSKDTSLRTNQIDPNHKSMNLKKQLTLMLDAKGITASELSRRSGVPKQSISGWLSGSNPRDVRQIKKVADALEISVDQLLFGNGIPKNDGTKNEILNSLIGDDWFSGLFEVKLRRVKK